MNKKKTYSFEVELTEDQVRSLCLQTPVDLPVTAKLAGIALDALQSFADGGMMLDGNVAREILQITGPISDPQELVRAVEAGATRDQGRLVGKWYIDPTYEPVLTEAANNHGVSVQQVIQDLMNWGVGQGWAYLMAPDTTFCFFTRADFDLVKNIVGSGEFTTGTDIAQWICKMSDSQGAATAATWEEIKAGVDSIGGDPADEQATPVVTPNKRKKAE